MSFDSFDFHPSIMAGIRMLGYEKPTQIQLKAIPLILQSRDVVGLAQTGTGKTAAFVLPVLQKLQEGPRGKLRTLIITPTRELAEQTCDVIKTMGGRTRLQSVTIYGGVSMQRQVQNLRRRPEIVVACPGRLLDHLWRGTIDLSDVETLVIDEADRMFDMGFLPDVRKLLKCIIQKHQTLLFSATMSADIRRLANEILQDPATVQVDKVMPAKSVSHALYPIKQHLKTDLLKEILSTTDTGAVIVFTRTKHRAEHVTQQLLAAGHQASSLQGNLSQNKRQAALRAFRNGSVKVLVATDIAARGIDILSISHVINYDMPECIDDYIHRIGRTGRVDNVGEALTFVTETDKPKIRSLERFLETSIERITLKGYDSPKVKEADKQSHAKRKAYSHFPRRNKLKQSK